MYLGSQFHWIQEKFRPILVKIIMKPLEWYTVWHVYYNILIISLKPEFYSLSHVLISCCFCIFWFSYLYQQLQNQGASPWETCGHSAKPSVKSRWTLEQSGRTHCKHVFFPSEGPCVFWHLVLAWWARVWKKSISLDIIINTIQIWYNLQS